jgi:hypothetical protein
MPDEIAPTTPCRTRFTDDSAWPSPLPVGSRRCRADGILPGFAAWPGREPACFRLWDADDVLPGFAALDIATGFPAGFATAADFAGLVGAEGLVCFDAAAGRFGLDAAAAFTRDFFAAGSRFPVAAGADLAVLAAAGRVARTFASVALPRFAAAPDFGAALLAFAPRPAADAGGLAAAPPRFVTLLRPAAVLPRVALPPLVGLFAIVAPTAERHSEAAEQ